MTYKIEVSEEAEMDIIVAYEWYEQQKPGLGEEFKVAINNSFYDIAKNPQYYSYKRKNIRGYIVKRFPYLILYVIKQTDINVISVFHMHRKPF
jgi:plasmid stabilization system protein ParE